MEEGNPPQQKRKASSPASSPEHDALSSKKPRLQGHPDDSPLDYSAGDRPAHEHAQGSPRLERRGSDAAEAGINTQHHRSRSRTPRGQRSPRRSRRSSDASPDRRRDRDYSRDKASARGRDRDREREHERERERAGEREREREKERRRVVSVEEKKRGQRLFGGLLSTLSQKPAGAHQNRRQEIERKQHEKAQQRRAEDDKRRKEKLAKLDRIRRTEQIQFDEKAMRTRHSDMMAAAHSLRTKSNPPIYYRPWEMTREQDDVIDRQIAEAEETAAEEVREFERDKQQRLADLGLPSHRLSKRDSTAGEPQADAPDDTSAAVSTNSPIPQHGIDKDRDDEMVITEEETLIY